LASEGIDGRKRFGKIYQKKMIENFEAHFLWARFPSTPTLDSLSGCSIGRDQTPGDLFE